MCMHVATSGAFAMPEAAQEPRQSGAGRDLGSGGPQRFSHQQTHLCRAVHAAQQGTESLHFQKVVQILMPEGPQHGHVQLS